MRVVDIRANTEGANLSLEEFNKSIEAQLKLLSGTLDEISLKALGSQIIDFTRLAVEQIKNKLEQKRNNDLTEVQTEIASEKTKALKSLEAFIATSPFAILEKMIVVKLIEGAYEAKGIYRCADNIQYEQLLDTKKSKLLCNQLRVSSLGSEVKVPISLGRNWLRKEQVPDYEKLDSYLLSAAEVDENHLIITFRQVEKNSNLKMVYSKHESHTSLTVELLVPPREVNITSNVGLNRYLDTKTFENIAEQVKGSILELESYKSGLTKLVLDNQNVLEKMDLFPFFTKSWQILAPKMIEEIGMSTEALKKGNAKFQDNVLTESFVREKAGSLGQNSKIVLQALKMNV